MNEVLIPLMEDIELQSPVAMEPVSATVSAPRREEAIPRQAWRSFASIAGLVGSLAVAGAVWQIGQASRAQAIPPAPDIWTKGRISTIGSQSMTLDTENGGALELGLNFGSTSVFQDKGVLSIAHLRQGQQVRVLSSRHYGTMMAKAIDISRSAIRARPQLGL